MVTPQSNGLFRKVRSEPRHISWLSIRFEEGRRENRGVLIMLQMGDTKNSQWEGAKQSSQVPFNGDQNLSRAGFISFTHMTNANFNFGHCSGFGFQVNPNIFPVGKF